MLINCKYSYGILQVYLFQVVLFLLIVVVALRAAVVPSQNIGQLHENGELKLAVDLTDDLEPAESRGGYGHHGHGHGHGHGHHGHGHGHHGHGHHYG